MYYSRRWQIWWWFATAADSAKTDHIHHIKHIFPWMCDQQCSLKYWILMYNFLKYKIIIVCTQEVQFCPPTLDNSCKTTTIKMDRPYLLLVLQMNWAVTGTGQWTHWLWFSALEDNLWCDALAADKRKTWRNSK